MRDDHRPLSASPGDSAGNGRICIPRYVHTGALTQCGGQMVVQLFLSTVLPVTLVTTESLTKYTAVSTKARGSALSAEQSDP
jgi:hypothetical protein